MPRGTTIRAEPLPLGEMIHGYAEGLDMAAHMLAAGTAPSHWRDRPALIASRRGKVP